MSPPLQAAYLCSEACGYGAPLTERVYRCPRCGALLDVAQDLAALRSVPPAEWRRRFESRATLARGPAASGVWSKQEWVYPQLPAEHIVTLGEGHAPLKGLPRMAARLGLESLELKECGVSPTGSFKDWGMTVLVSAVKHLRASGAPVRAVACASTGDTSAALAAYCASAGIPAVVFLPRDKVSLAQLAQPIANGARVLSLDTDFDGCMRLVQAVTQRPEEGLYLANSMNALRIEGQKIVAVELCQQLGWEVPDWVLIPGGNLGNASALGKGFELLLALGLVTRRPRIAVAQAERANPLARAFRGGFRELLPMSAGPTLASAIRIGNPVSFRRAVRTLQAFDGVVEDASEAELARAAAQADREGTFTCPHTGVALAALEKLCRQGTIARGARVVVVSTAHGLKFTDFKVGYHRGALPEVPSDLANPPLELPADLGAVREALAQLG
jgi:threonine synthase